MTDLSKSEKIPSEKRFFNISTLWIPYFRQIIKILYILRIPHEIITLTSIAFGLLSSWYFYQGQLILGAITFHLKDLFDACDGAIARMTGRGHLIGRYLDSLGDFAVIHAVIIAISWRAVNMGDSTMIYWGGASLLSLFIQCSFFNY